MTFAETDIRRDSDGKFTDKEGQAPEVALIPDNHRLTLDDGDSRGFTHDDLGTDIGFESVWVERDGDNYYVEGKTLPVDFHNNLYPDLEPDAQAAALARDWKTIAETVNDTYCRSLDPARPRNDFAFTPDLGEFEAQNLTSNKLRKAALEYEDGEGYALAAAVRDGSFYSIVRNAIQQDEPDADDDGN